MKRLKAYRNNIRRYLAAALFFAFHFSFFASASAQNQIANLMSFDNNLLHFGIQVGYTNSKFDLSFSEDDELRLFRLAKDEGCRFYLASDAHHPDKLATVPDVGPSVVSALGLSARHLYRLP